MSHSSKLSGTQELCPSDYCKSLRICDLKRVNGQEFKEVLINDSKWAL